MRRFLPFAVLLVGCGSTTANPFAEPTDADPSQEAGADSATNDGSTPDVAPGDDTSSGDDVITPTDGAPTDTGSSSDVATETGGPVEPTTCAEAVAAKSNVGCDFWPTVVANNVWSIFDYAVVIANAGSADSVVTVTGPNGVNQNVTVAKGALQTVYLPWVPALKGADTDACGTAVKLPGSVLAKGGAYHLVATRPVTVFQFSPLEYKPIGGPAGKNWGSCPGTVTSCTSGGQNAPIGCFAYSADASLLLPTSSLTGNYRVFGMRGWTSGTTEVMNPYVAITATQDGTAVKVKVAPGGHILAGGTDIAAAAGGGTVDLTMNAGDVAQLVGQPNQNSDLSGSQITATKPVQVIAGIPCIQVPTGTNACDHIEESLFPAETLGRDYFVTVPTAPNGSPVAHTVRFYGNRAGTTLTYLPSKPTGAPDTLDAGQVVEVTNATASFRVTANHEIGVASFMQGGAKVDPQTVNPSRGDPSMSLVTPLEQWRRRYIFLAPLDYDTSYADVVYPSAATVTLDGLPLPAGTGIGSTGYYVARVKLAAGAQGAHELSSTLPVGLQVMGYGSYTSYQYPGGVDLKAIAPPPL